MGRTKEQQAAAREERRAKREAYAAEVPPMETIRRHRLNGQTFSQIVGPLNKLYNPPPGCPAWDLVETVKAAPRPSWAT